MLGLNTAPVLDRAVLAERVSQSSMYLAEAGLRSQCEGLEAVYISAGGFAEGLFNVGPATCICQMGMSQQMRLGKASSGPQACIGMSRHCAGMNCIMHGMHGAVACLDQAIDCWDHPGGGTGLDIR